MHQSNAFSVSSIGHTLFCNVNFCHFYELQKKRYTNHSYSNHQFYNLHSVGIENVQLIFFQQASYKTDKLLEEKVIQQNGNRTKFFNLLQFVASNWSISQKHQHTALVFISSNLEPIHPETYCVFCPSVHPCTLAGSNRIFGIIMKQVFTGRPSCYPTISVKAPKKSQYRLQSWNTTHGMYATPFTPVPWQTNYC